MSAEGWSSPIVGVMGGLGPAATVSFLDLLVRLTKADRDQDHIDAIVLQHSTTPDRTAALLDPTAPDPTPALVADAQRLERMGADFLVLPCNSANIFTEPVERAIGIELLSIVQETARVALALADGPIAVFATEGTIHAGTYHEAITRGGGIAWTPPRPLQATISAIIYDQVKAGRPVDLGALHASIDVAREAGCSHVIFGCTELSVVYDREGLSERVDVVDSLRTLAEATIRKAGRALVERGTAPA